MGLFGGLGKLAGGLIGGLFGKKGGAIGEEIGGGLGDLVPFKTGGPVTKTGPALIHKGEFVLPANAKVTKAQRAIVAKNKAAMKRRK